MCFGLFFVYSPAILTLADIKLKSTGFHIGVMVIIFTPLSIIRKKLCGTQGQLMIIVLLHCIRGHDIKQVTSYISPG